MEPSWNHVNMRNVPAVLLGSVPEVVSYELFVATSMLCSVITGQNLCLQTFSTQFGNFDEDAML